MQHVQCVRICVSTTLAWMFKLTCFLGNIMETWFVHRFDSQPVQRYNTLWLITLIDMKHLIVGLGLQVWLGSM